MAETTFPEHVVTVVGNGPQSYGVGSSHTPKSDLRNLEVDHIPACTLMGFTVDPYEP